LVNPYEKSRPGIYYNDGGFDPYFIVNADTEIRTKVLTNAIDALKLDASQTARMLSRRVKVIPERKIGTAWIIQVTEENPNEAMQLANAIAKSYADYGVALAKLQTAAELQILQKDYTNEKTQILTLQTNVDLSEKRQLTNLAHISQINFTS
jgi:capsular polysaccharide biosynthesis protein